MRWAAPARTGLQEWRGPRDLRRHLKGQTNRMFLFAGGDREGQGIKNDLFLTWERAMSGADGLFCFDGLSLENL